jgi:hypothetical protein
MIEAAGFYDEIPEGGKKLRLESKADVVLRQ